jgi:hypothetical protein
LLFASARKAGVKAAAPVVNPNFLRKPLLLSFMLKNRFIVTGEKLIEFFKKVPRGISNFYQWISIPKTCFLYNLRK